jgi:hypothetical protein
MDSCLNSSLLVVLGGFDALVDDIQRDVLSQVQLTIVAKAKED